jgi:hypothetical protein
VASKSIGNLCRSNGRKCKAQAFFAVYEHRGPLVCIGILLIADPDGRAV